MNSTNSHYSTAAANRGDFRTAWLCRALSYALLLSCASMLLLCFAAKLLAQEPSKAKPDAMRSAAKAKAESSAARALRAAQNSYRDGQYRQAEKLTLDALADAKALKITPPLAAGFEEVLSNVYRVSNRPEKALQSALRYQKMLEQLAGSSTRMDSKRQQNLNAIAEIVAVQGDKQAAIDWLQKSLALAQGLRKTEPLWEPTVRTRLGQLRGELEQAEATTDFARALDQISTLLAQLDAGKFDERYRPLAIDLLTECAFGLDRVERNVETLTAMLGRLKPDDPVRVVALSQIARCQHHLHEPAAERDALQQAIALQDQIDAGAASAQRAELQDRLGAACESLGGTDDLAAAMTAWRESTALYEELLKSSPKSDRHLAIQMQHRQSMQMLYQRQGQWSEGAQVTAQLLAYRIKTLVKGDPAIYRAKSALGAFYVKSEDYNAARPLLEDAADYWRKRRPPARDELTGTLSALAEVGRATGDFQSAVILFDEVRELLEAQLPSGDLRLAEVYANLASVQAALGQYKLAFDNCELAEAICRREENAALPQAHEVLAITLLNKAMVYKSQRQLDRAAEFCAEALKLRKQKLSSDDDVALLPYYLALASLHLAKDRSLAADLRDPQDLETAIELANQARRICNLNHLDDEPVAANTEHLLGMIYFYQMGDKPPTPEQLSTAREAWQKALRIAKRKELLPLQARCLTYQAELDFRAHDLAQADKHSAAAVALHEQVGAYPNLQFMAMVTRAQVLRANDENDASRSMLDQAITLIESPRATTTGAETERAEYFSQFSVAFDLLVDWNVTDGHLGAALQAAEAGRNRTFLDQVRAAGVDLRATLKGSPQEHLLEEEQQILAHYNELRDEAQQVAAGSRKANLQQLADQLAAARSDYARVVSMIRNSSSYYRSLLAADGSEATWSEQLRAVVGDENLLLLYYLGHKRSHLFVVGKGGEHIKHYELQITPDDGDRLAVNPGPLSRHETAELVGRYQSWLRRAPAGLAIKDRGLGDKTVKSGGRSMTAGEAMTLASIVLPVAARREVAELDPQYVAVVADGALHELPLEALILGIEPVKYLLDEFPAISYGPSVKVLAALIERPRSAGKQGWSLLTLGNPTYPEQKTTLRGDQAVGILERLHLNGPLSALPATEEESRQVGEAFEGIKSAQLAIVVDPITGPEATEKNLRDHIAGKDFIHLAAHGLVDQENENLFGCIALTPPSKVTSTDDDGFLLLGEIAGLKLENCELAILSACQTNVGPQRPLEAGSTMARAFLSAGARRVVSSHWNVEDQSTAMLIGAFADELAADLKAGRTPHYAVALQKARRAVRAKPQRSAPYYWAPFVLIGPAD